MYTQLCTIMHPWPAQILCVAGSSASTVICAMWPCCTSGPVDTQTGAHRQWAARSHPQSMVKNRLQVCRARAAPQGRRAARAPRRRAASRAPPAPHVHARPAPTALSEQRAAKAPHYHQCIPMMPNASSQRASKTTAMTGATPTLVTENVAACCTAQQHSTCRARAHASHHEQSCAIPAWNKARSLPPPAAGRDDGAEAARRPRARRPRQHEERAVPDRQRRLPAQRIGQHLLVLVQVRDEEEEEHVGRAEQHQHGVVQVEPALVQVVGQPAGAPARRRRRGHHRRHARRDVAARARAPRRRRCAARRACRVARLTLAPYAPGPALRNTLADFCPMQQGHGA